MPSAATSTPPLPTQGRTRTLLAATHGDVMTSDPRSGCLRCRCNTVPRGGAAGAEAGRRALPEADADTQARCRLSAVWRDFSTPIWR